MNWSRTNLYLSLTLCSLACFGIASLAQLPGYASSTGPKLYSIETLADASRVAAELRKHHIGKRISASAMGYTLRGKLLSVRSMLIEVQTDNGVQREDLSNVTDVTVLPPSNQAKPTPSVSSRVASHPLVGSWRLDFQYKNSSWTSFFEIATVESQQAGTFSSPDLGCDGYLLLQRRDKEVYVIRAVLNNNPKGRCSDEGYYRIVPEGSGFRANLHLNSGQWITGAEMKKK